MGRVRRLRAVAALSAVGLAAVMALAGCGGSSRGDDAARSAAGADAGSADQAAPGAAEGRPAEKDVPTDLRLGQRAIIYTGTIVVRVEDVDRAAAQAASFATTAGGFVGGDQRTSNDSRSEASLQLRVPADEFSEMVERIAGLGEQERRDINTKDVTEEALDLDARIATQRARVESGRRLLAQAKTLNELILLEGELAKREADLASLEAKKRQLDDLTALSTITAVLLGPDAQVSGDGPRTGFLAGLEGGWKAFLVSMEILLTVLGALLPWAIALGVPAYGLVWLVRRLGRRNRPVPPTGPVPVGAGAQRIAGPTPLPSGAVPSGAVPAARPGQHTPAQTPTPGQASTPAEPSNPAG